MISWEEKTEMIKLGNNVDLNYGKGLKEFQDFVIAHFKTFDDQAWDMFFTIIHLTPKDINKNLQFYKEIINEIKGFSNETNATFGTRTAMRIEIFLMIYAEESQDL